MDDNNKKSSTATAVVVSCSVVLILVIICTAMYVVAKQPQLQFICHYSWSHPILALNLLILLIIVSSRCFAISRNIDHRDQFLLLADSPQQRIIPLNSASQADSIAEARTSKSKKKGTLESTWKKTNEGSHLRQLKHSHITTEDSIRPAELLTDRGNDEVTSSGSSSLSSAKLRKEVSLTKEEVNRRVERFIRKFNDD